MVVERLKTRSQFQAVLAGERAGATAHFVLHRCRSDGPAVRDRANRHAVAEKAVSFAQGSLWLGAMVPKRWAKRAVTRNTIKRQIYTVSSEIVSSLPAAAYVVRLRAGFDRAQYRSASSSALKLAVRKELEQLFSIARRPVPNGPCASVGANP